ncbi:MAG: hypothetical protein ACOYN8_08870 [Pseudanabaena sp.]
MSRDFWAIVPTIYFLKAIAFTMSHDSNAIASTIYLLKAITITMSYEFYAIIHPRNSLL